MEKLNEKEQQIAKQILKEMRDILKQSRKTLSKLNKALKKPTEEDLIELSASVKAFGGSLACFSGFDTYKKGLGALRILQIAELCATQDKNEEVKYEKNWNLYSGAGTIKKFA